MAITALNPYLGFNGTAAKAVELYQTALGAKAEHVMRWADGPPDMKVPPEMKDRIMHAELVVDGQRFMLADSPSHAQAPGNNVSVCLQLNDNADMKRKFDALAVGGKVGMPIHDAFWGATFGMLTDAYGISWMFVGPKR